VSGPDPRQVLLTADQALRRFMTWWLGALASLLPQRWRPNARFAAFRLRHTASGWEVAVFSKGRTQKEASDTTWHVLADLPAPLQARLRKERRVLVALPELSVLVGETELPLRATRNLQRVMRYQLERLTPFEAGQVAFDCRVDGVAQHGMARVEYALVDHATLLTMLNELEPYGITQSMVHLDLAARGLDPLRATGRHSATWRWIWVGAAAAASGLIWLLAATHVDHLELNARSLEQEIVTMRRVASKVEALRIEASAVEASQRRLAEQARVPDGLDLLAEVTSRLDDATSLTALQLVGDEIRLTGVGPSAAAVLLQLERSPILLDLRYASAVTRLRDDPHERFEIAARLRREPR
jgi:general secretion pathway protein L